MSKPIAKEKRRWPTKSKEKAGTKLRTTVGAQAEVRQPQARPKACPIVAEGIALGIQNETRIPP